MNFQVSLHTKECSRLLSQVFSEFPGSPTSSNSIVECGNGVYITWELRSKIQVGLHIQRNFISVPFVALNCQVYVDCSDIKDIVDFQVSLLTYPDFYYPE